MIVAQLVGCPAELAQRLQGGLEATVSVTVFDIDTSADIVVVGPDEPNPIGVTQSVFRRDPDTIVVVAVPEADQARITEALRFAPFVGIATKVTDPAPDAVLVAVGEAAARAEAARLHARRVEAAGRSLLSPASGTGGYLTADVRQLVERLQAREAFLAALVESSSDTIVSIDLDGVVTSWNPAADELYGYSADEVVGTPITSIVPEHRLQEMEAALAAVRHGETITGLETVRLTRDGRAVDVAVTLSPMRDAAGTVRWTSEIGRDIGYRKTAERALRQAERRKAAVIEASIDGIITADHRGRILEFNPGAERIFGWKASEVIGKEMADTIIPPIHRDAHRHGLSRYLRTGESHILGRQIELAARRADGSDFPVELGITAVDLDGTTLFTAHVRDITERKRAEGSQRAANDALRRYTEELEESEQTIRRAQEEAIEAARRADLTLDQASDALVAVDPEGRIVLFNQAAQSMFGYAFDEVKDRPLEILVPPAAAERHPGLVQAFIRSGHGRRLMAPDRSLLTARRKDGSEFPAAITVGPIDLGTGTAMGMAVVRDQTRVVEAERAIVEAATLLERRNVELEQFLFIASHDLKEPLRKIESFGGELRQAVPELEEWPALCLDRMLDATDRMGRLLAALETYSQVISRRREVADCDLGRIVADVLVDLELRIEESGATVEVGDLPTVPGDEVHLLAIFQNLVGNALKFTREGESPVVGVFSRTPSESGTVEIVVEDEGIGIDPAYAHRAFEPFRRLHESDRYQGTGIGLAIAGKVAQLAGGSIRAEPASAGAGTAMVVTLPTGV
ncbi:MAG TPA: PAS domain S-box protein [Acidimicrobiia bacterium]